MPFQLDRPLQTPPTPIPVDGEPRILIAVRQPGQRAAIAGRLRDAGLQVTTAATFGVVEVLLELREAFDLMVIAQSSEETALFGMAQLARSIDLELPILVVEDATANSPAVVDLVQGALTRWPIRERTAPAIH